MSPTQMLFESAERIWTFVNDFLPSCWYINIDIFKCGERGQCIMSPKPETDLPVALFSSEETYFSPNAIVIL